MKQNYEECLAKRSHGKWKSALGHTLLIIGMVLVSLGAFAQTPAENIPSGLKMSKRFIPYNDENTRGKVVLETYVTGSSITTTAAVPNDIVLVLDQSGSMNEIYSGSTKKVDALKDAVETFCNTVKQNAIDNGVNHKIAIVGFASGYNTGSTNRPNWDWTNTALLSTSSVTSYGNRRGQCVLDEDDYQNALVTARQGNTQNLNPRLDDAISAISASGGTCMQYGLEMAYGVLSNRTETTFTLPDGSVKPRGQIVIFFTDGYAGLVMPEYPQGNTLFGQRNNGADYIVCQTTADAAVAQANNLKENGATIFSLGIFEGVDPDMAYQTEEKTISSYYTQDPYGGYNTNYYQITYWEPHTAPTSGSGDAAANGLLHMISSNYDDKNPASLNLPGNADSWLDETTNSDNVANRFHEFTYEEDGKEKTWKPKYFGAGTPEELNAVFSSIADQSGAEPLELSAETMVQDAVSTNFTLPEGASIDDIRVWAPKCTNAVLDGETVVSCTFADTINGNGRLTLNADGVVTGGTENRLPNSVIKFVNYDANGNLEVDEEGNPIYSTTPTKYIRISGFNFKEMYCGKENGQPHGRKLVIAIPIKAAEGTWGDGMETNGPLSFVLPDGSQVYYQFEGPVTNVMGSVWTEVVHEKPDGYSDDNIDSPEDLAWFISRVNGRAGYTDNDTCWSHPTINGKLTADIDMSAHNWVPIGAGFKCANGKYVDANGNPVTNDNQKVKLAYAGTFDGNGHVITGLKNNASKFYKLVEGGANNKVVVFPGMFSTVTGTVHDVFILDSDFRGKHHTSNFIHHGILADTLAGGTIYNCEAAGRLTCNNDKPEDDKNLIYGGLVGLNNGGTIYNSMAMAELTGYTMGGAVGENRSGSFSNGFTNGLYKYLGEDNTYKVGGIAGTNAGTVNNCYVRFERYNENLDKATFDQLVGSGTEATNSYTQQLVTWSRPNVESNTTKINTNTTVPVSATITDPDDNDADSYTISVSKTLYNMFTNDNMTGGTWGTTQSGDNIYNTYQNGTPLVDKLNDYVDKYEGDEQLSSWKRTTAGNYDVAHGSGDINDDFPVLQLPDYTCLGSSDGIRIDYARNLSDMLHRHNTGNISENSSTYNKTAHEAIFGGTINLFANDDNRSTAKAQKVQSTGDNVVVYIDEDVSLLQDAGEDNKIEAYTGQTLYSFTERWHFVSSSLKDSQFGWTYIDNGVVEHNWEPDPCGWTLNTNEEDKAFFPIDLQSWKRADFYCFYEPQYHWINFRRNSLSHWHMDNYTLNIPYTNETQFKQGKGYLVANQTIYGSSYGKNYQFIQNRGTLGNGDITIDVTASAPDWTGLKGYNLLGNPYQSYLDFEKFITENTGEGKIWSGDEAFAQTYAVYDPEAATYLQYKESTSKEAKAADQNINMHQGFMIRVSKAGTAKFTNDMRTNTKGNGFRGTENHYPLINFTLNNGTTNDVAVLELGRPENDGALKLRVGDTKGRISLRHDNQDFGILFRDITEGSQPLYFDTDEDGTFTLSWNTANADFSSLTLVDNLTGVKYDMLANDSYTFQGNASDYRSRFKVVIGRFTGIDEEDGPSTGSGTFAFFDGSDWVVNGQGQLTVTDMTGRTVYSSNLTNDQNRVSLNGVANGVYLMRVANGQNVNVQKIVVR